jgi:murein DD-endopeptidase MepM/ murein hydrolase activator NlpD
MRRIASLLLACALLAGSLASTAAPAAAAGEYLLPAPAGTALYVTGGNGGYHQGWEQYAWDFTVGKTEFPVAAARGGMVIGAWGGSQDPQDNCYPDGSCWARANYVLVDHCDGKTAGLYMHLAYGTVKVAVGQRVTTGTILGNADNTGWSSGTHLHFQVEQLPPGVDGRCSGPPPASATGSAGWWFRQSVPITFGDFDVLAKTSSGTLGVPVKGQTYDSSNTTAATPTPTPTPTPSPLARPGTPGGVTVAVLCNPAFGGDCPGGPTLRATWKGAGGGVAGYRVYWQNVNPCTNPESYLPTLHPFGQTNATARSVTGSIPNGTFVVRLVVVAYNAAGTGTAAHSIEQPLLEGTCG